ncbi:MAG: phosphoglycerate dehydrogenase [Bacteroidota bacterium]
MADQRRVVITSSSVGKVSEAPFKILKEAGCEVLADERGPFRGEKLVQVLSRGEAVIVGQDELNRSVLEALRGRLRVIVKNGAGVDNIDLEAARECGISVANVPAMNADAVAEFAVGLMLAAARKIPQADRDLRAGKWSRFYGLQLTGKTFGIVGFGRIGQLVARKLRGFDPVLLAYDPYPNEQALAELGTRLVGLDELLSASDIVSLHLPLTEETAGLLGRERLALLKPGALLVNTARAGVVEPEALAEALASGRLGAVAVDVFAAEPSDPADPLLHSDRTVCTPHIASYTYEAMEATSVQAARNIVDLLEGRPCPFVLK